MPTLRRPRRLKRAGAKEQTPAAASPATPPRKRPGPKPRGGRVYDPAKHCGAQLRKKERGRLCLQLKGTKTPHLGEGKCWLHGGLTPIKHGLNSLIKHSRLKDMLRKMQEIDHDVMDLTPEVELLRAMTYDFVNRYDDFIEALTSWYDDIDVDRKANELPPVPRRFPTLEDAGQLLEAISRMVERIHKITREGSITMDVFRSLMTQMGMAVADEVADPLILEKIEQRWRDLMVHPRSFQRTGWTAPLPTDDGEEPA